MSSGQEVIATRSERTAALNFLVGQREIYWSTLFPSPSLKSNSWHSEAIWSRSMGLTPTVICLTALGGGQVRCARVYVRARTWWEVGLE